MVTKKTPPKTASSNKKNPPKNNAPKNNAPKKNDAPKTQGPEKNIDRVEKTNLDAGGTNINRVALSSPAQVGAASRVQGTTLGPSSNVNAAQIDPVTQAQAAQLGPAAQAQAAQLGPAAQIKASQLDMGGYNQYRNDNRGLIAQLQAQANGTGPSVAEAQYKLAADRGLAQQLAMAASQRGRGAGLAGRNAMMNSATMNQGLAAQSAIDRMKEQQAAQQLMGSQINYGMQNDLTASTNNATLNQAADLANADSTNKFGLAQGQMQNDTNLANMNALNTTNIAQGSLSNEANLANALAGNTRSFNQANLNQQAGTTNALEANRMAIAQGQLTSGESIANAGYEQDRTKLTAALQQQADLANSGAINQANQAQASINAGMQNAGAGASATVRAAQAGASASMYGTDVRAGTDMLINGLVGNDNRNTGTEMTSNQQGYANKTS